MTEAVNTFTNGMVMDLHPLTTPNNVLTNCLNGTYITYNGNEMILQNDMGNGRVETAKLPAGYIPVGVVSHGGIIYVASYNPIEQMSQIGCFPSPERNISSEDTGMQAVGFTPGDDLVEEILGKKYLKEAPVRKNVALQEIHPGDQFMVASFPEEDWFKTELVSITDSNQILPVTSRFTVEDDEVKPTWTYYSSKYPGLLAFQFTPYLLKEFSVAYDISKIQSENTSKGCLKLKWDSVPENKNAPLAKVEVEAYYVSGDFKELAFRGTDNFQTNGNWLFVTEENTEYNHLDLTHQLNIDPSPIDPQVKKIGVRVTPMMKYTDKNGQEDYARIRTMSKYFEVDIDAIDSNAIDLNEYRYKVTLDNESATGKLLLSYGFSGDLADGVEITDCTLDIFDLDDNPIFGKNNPIQLKKQLGYFTIELEFDDTFKSNSLYIVQFNVIAKKDGVLKRENKEARFLYTSTIFNKHYSIAENSDYKKLNPNLTFTPEIKEKDNITVTYDSENSKVGPGAGTNNTNPELNRGYSLYNIGGSLDLEIIPKLSDSLFGINVNHSIEYIDTSTLTTVDESIFDSDPFLKPRSDEESLSYTVNNDSLNVSGTTRSIVYCENTYTDIAYRFAWVPLVYDFDTAYDNNLEYDENTGSFKVTQFAFIGGNDYDNHPRYAQTGVGEIGVSNNKTTLVQSSDKERLEVKNHRLAQFLNTDDFGMKNNRNMQDNFSKLSLIPTILAHSPGNRDTEMEFKIYSDVDVTFMTPLETSENYKYKNEILELSDDSYFISNHGWIIVPKIPKDAPTDLYNNVFVFFQIKTKEQLYVPLNVWLLVNSSSINQGIYNKYSSKTVGDLMFYILNQIYVRKEISETKEKQWVIDKSTIKFIKRYEKKAEFNYKINWETPEISICNKTIEDLQQIAKHYSILENNIKPEGIILDSDKLYTSNKIFEVIEYKHADYDDKSNVLNQVTFVKNSNNVVGLSNELSKTYGYVNGEGKIVNWDNNARIYLPKYISISDGKYMGNYDFNDDEQNYFRISDYSIENNKLILENNTSTFDIKICNTDSNDPDEQQCITKFNRNATFFEGLKLVD